MAPHNPHHRRFYHSIRFKLLLVSLTLTAIPWTGYRYIQETEAFLRQGQEKVLLGTAQAVATVLHNREELFIAGANSAQTLYVHHIDTPIQLDGYADDWTPYLRNARHYKTNSEFSVSNIIAQRGRHLYALFQVKDSHIVYHRPGSKQLKKNDHLLIAMEQPNGDIAHYQLATSAPGWINAYRATNNIKETRISGEWQEAEDGYTIEIRIPLRMLGKRLAFSIADVDDSSSRTIQSTISTNNAGQLGLLVTPSPVIEQIVNNLEHEDARIWVLDTQHGVLAQKGTLKQNTTQPENIRDESSSLLHNIFRLVLTQPTDFFEDTFSGTSRLQGLEIESALKGTPKTRRRITPDQEAVIISAAWPIHSEQGILGAVLVEQSTNAIQSLQNKTLERLFSITFIFFSITSLALLGFASLLTSRIHKLRDKIEATVTPDGRIKGQLQAGTTQDEIDDLSRSFANILSRLGEYNRYLEAMASRLAHELRTPLTIVKTSLDNLEAEIETEKRTHYLHHAKNGAERLGLILHHMREATRLEQLLQHSETERFDLTEMIQIATENYRTVYPNIIFNSKLPNSSIYITGSPDLISQALDKLISNAADFHQPNTPIQIELDYGQIRQACLSIINSGPTLPNALGQELFESMISIRTTETTEPHLGLGLYLVKLICEFHGGSVVAENLTDNSGVVFKLMLPISE
ncbi:proteobacterial dedicated sortase system histidine kinase [Pseudomonadota bacterium]